MNTVKFVNETQEIQVASNANLREQALKNGIEIYKGTNNLSPETATEFQKLKKKPTHSRLACQAFIKGDVSVKTKP
jgi:ferredoxin